MQRSKKEHKGAKKKKRKRKTDNSRLTKTSQPRLSEAVCGEQKATVKDRLAYTIMYSPVFIKENFNQFEGANSIKY